MIVVGAYINRTGSQRLSMLRQLHSYPATGRKRAYEMAHISFSQMLHGQDRDGEVRRQGREQLLQRPRSAGRRRQRDDSGLPAVLRWLVTRLHSTGSPSELLLVEEPPGATRLKWQLCVLGICED